jgi:uncharacterized protein YbgA (DUF1722 family)/uncharacterized protein YbbK (DUF523 family)
VGISSCLLGQNVRFDGGHKRDAYIVGTLTEYFEFHPVCPEVAIGLGVPRSSIHLVNSNNETRCVGTKNSDMDVTDLLRDYAVEKQSGIQNLCGYILKKDSPSCGMERVRVFQGNQSQRVGVGIFAEELMRNNPLLPVEEEGRLGDPALRENFIQRVFVLYRWRLMLINGLSINELMKFHARHKLIIMSHGDYTELGRMCAEANKNNLMQIAESYILLLMKTLRSIVQRSQHVNVLQHIQGYLKKELTADNKAELLEIIERYANGEIPLIVPLTLLKHHFRQFKDAYIDQSYYMTPYPDELKLINQL